MSSDKRREQNWCYFQSPSKKEFSCREEKQSKEFALHCFVLWQKLANAPTVKTHFLLPPALTFKKKLKCTKPVEHAVPLLSFSCHYAHIMVHLRASLNTNRNSLCVPNGEEEEKAVLRLEGVVVKLYFVKSQRKQPPTSPPAFPKWLSYF